MYLSLYVIHFKIIWAHKIWDDMQFLPVISVPCHWKTAEILLIFNFIQKNASTLSNTHHFNKVLMAKILKCWDCNMQWTKIFIFFIFSTRITLTNIMSWFILPRERTTGDWYFAKSHWLSQQRNEYLGLLIELIGRVIFMTLTLLSDQMQWYHHRQ